MNNFVKQLMLIPLVSGLIGCAAVTGPNSVVHDRKNEYLASHSGKPLIVPQGATTRKFEMLYPVPAETVHTREKPPIVPPGSQLESNTNAKKTAGQ